MAWLHRRIFRLPTTRARLASEIDDELLYHLETRAAELIAAGNSPEDAWRRAAREFGDLGAARAELTRVDERRLGRQRRADVIDVIGQDLRYAWRGLGRQPGFAAIVVLTLALAVGANSAVFSLVDPLLFRTPAGLTAPGLLHRLYLNRRGAVAAPGAHAIGDRFSYPEYRAIRAATADLGEVGAYIARDSVPLVTGGDTTFAHVGYATAGFLPLLGVHADIGRLFTEREDDVENPANSAVVTPSFARRVFGTGVNPLGRTFELNERHFDVVGVLAPHFTGIDVAGVDLWAPFSTSRRVGAGDAHSWYRQRDSYIQLVARISPRGSEGAFAARASVADRSAWESGEAEFKRATVLTGSIIAARGPAAPRQEVSISTRLAIVALIVLLVACANIANLLLLRASSRQREMAVRLALGVSRRRLASQLLTEALLLALLAGVGAVFAASWTGGALRHALLPRTNWVGAALTPRVFAFTLGVAIAAGCIVALVPLMLAQRPDFGSALAVGNRKGISARSRTRDLLLATQVALSVVLIAGAGLFVRSLRSLENVPLGIGTQHLVVGFVYFGDGKHHPELSALMPDVAARIRQMPGVRAVAYGSGAPLLSWGEGERIIPDGSNSADSVSASDIAVSPGYFEAAGTRVLRGRGFRAADAEAAQPVMIVSRRTAEQLWPGRNPLQQCARIDDPAGPCRRIVGVTEDAHQLRLVEDWSPQFYLPFAQAGHLPPWALTIRANGASAADVAIRVGAELRRDFPGAIITSKTATAAIEPQLRPWQLGAHLFTGLGLLSLIVAGIGLYGIIAFSVQRRTKEFGIRVALGARALDVLRTITSHSVMPVLVGISVGVFIALAAGRFVAALLYGVSPRDPVSIAAGAASLLLAAVLASLVPARRAVRVDPVAALREE